MQLAVKSPQGDRVQYDFYDRFRIVLLHCLFPLAGPWAPLLLVDVSPCRPTKAAALSTGLSRMAKGAWTIGKRGRHPDGGGCANRYTMNGAKMAHAINRPTITPAVVRYARIMSYTRYCGERAT